MKSLVNANSFIVVYRQEGFSKICYSYLVATLTRSTNEDFRIQIPDFRIQENQDLRSSRCHRFILFMQYKQKWDKKGQVCCFFVLSFLGQVKHMLSKLAEQTETEGLLLSSAYLRLFDNDFC